MAITLTESAAAEIKGIIAQQQKKNAEEQGGDPQPFFLRVGVKGGGCSGFSYSLDLTETMTDTDDSWDQHGVQVICDSRSVVYLKGTAIDFQDGLQGRGFVFSNPNATSSCGCGSSFSV